MTYEIKKGVPIARHGNTQYPFADMDVGDCFDHPADDPRGQQRIASAAGRYVTRHGGGKFTTRRIGDVIRCWRIA